MDENGDDQAVTQASTSLRTIACRLAINDDTFIEPISDAGIQAEATTPPYGLRSTPSGGMPVAFTLLGAGAGQSGNFLLIMSDMRRLVHN